MGYYIKELPRVINDCPECGFILKNRNPTCFCTNPILRIMNEGLIELSALGVPENEIKEGIGIIVTILES